MGKVYSKSHEWVKKVGDIFLVGITEHAARELGDVVYVEMPNVGAVIKFDKSFGIVESVKSVSDLISPISGEVLEINVKLESNPELLNQGAEEESLAWILKVKASNESELAQLISKDDYYKFVSQE